MCDEPVERSDSSDEVSLASVPESNWRKRFVELIFGPALAKLPAKNESRLKGAGNTNVKRWHIHQSNWSKISFHVEKISKENDVFSQFL